MTIARSLRRIESSCQIGSEASTLSQSQGSAMFGGLFLSNPGTCGRITLRHLEGKTTVQTEAPHLKEKEDAQNGTQEGAQSRRHQEKHSDGSALSGSSGKPPRRLS